MTPTPANTTVWRIYTETRLNFTPACDRCRYRRSHTNPGHWHWPISGPAGERHSD